ncbi:MAG: UDP-N-acetylglucosamine--N-acetylmuramyl-(pentapeptide) pyrophosphoryl-undecaprenol N-acetylglucosamine transferase [bacterium]|nr:UDP-N-acetylglucosamine--N-acetylmuramyl-(pentapeptide) pyrophosphoryl-undecaprenol N-acetylglucosamine transferase [bacterium]
MTSSPHIRIMVTGGHVTPALAVIDLLKQKYPTWEIIFIGRRHAFERDTHESQEYRLIKERMLPFLPLISGRLQRNISPASFLSLLKVPIGFAQGFFYCLWFRPSGIVSFGGYLALPVVFAAWLLGIPVVTHEQTRVAGLANRMIACVAKRVLLTYPETAAQFPKSKTVVTGLPIRKRIFSPPTHPSYFVPNDLPVLYITGGTTGSVSLNRLIFPLIPAFVSRFFIVHQVGEPSLSDAQSVRAGLSKKLATHYHFASYFSVDDHSWSLNRAALVIGRSGANTVGEIAACGKIALFIPLPWAGGNEQYHNAKFLKDAGSAKILLQDTCTKETIRQAIDDLLENARDYRAHAAEIQKRWPNDGAERVVRALDEAFSIEHGVSRVVS